MANLKNMTITDLLNLRKGIDAMLVVRRGDLEKQLEQIGGGSNGKIGGKSALAGKTVAAKYRHPKTGEEWSGRGGVAKWLAAEIKAGKKKESFLIK